jgi:trk system potassium uptake protein TrkA
MLKEYGAKYVISNANRDRQADFLKKIGADEVIYPEKESAVKNAVRFTDNHIFEYMPMTEDYSIYEIDTPDLWIGKTITDLNIRKKYNINIVAIKNDTEFNPVPDPQYVFKAEDHLVIIGKNDIIEKITKKTI